MSAPAQRGYRFRTPAQWGACLFDGVDGDAFAAQAAVRPAAPYAPDGELLPTSGARAPALTPAGTALWRDGAGGLHRLPTCLDEPETVVAPHGMAHAERIVATPRGLWVIGPARTTLERYEEESLTRLDVVPVAGAPVLDLAGDARGRLFALTAAGGAAQVACLDCHGHIAATLSLPGIADATAIAYLRRARRFGARRLVILGGGGAPRLYWCAADTGAILASIAVGALGRCFVATALGSDGRGRVFLAGSDSAAMGGQPAVLVFDGDGSLLDEIALDVRDGAPTGVAGARGRLLVTGQRGLLRYRSAPTVPDGKAQVRCTLVTPMLCSPVGQDPRRWLRIEADATLPDGAALAIAYASTSDERVQRRLAQLAGEGAVLPAWRARSLLGEPGLWSRPMVFHGGAAAPGAPLAVPLFDVSDPWVWVAVTLTATAGGALPTLRELAVLYPGQTLMDQLPAIYRRSAAQPGSFLRALVGVLECTTQDLDARIGALASHVHPATAPTPWLDFIAGWLGLPWDEALDEGQKRRLVMCAAQLARGRGTRAGLETLLACLMPGTPARFRVIDNTADAGFAVVGGPGCRGSTLPAMLAGHTAWRTTLDFTTVLGRMRLGCAAAAGDPALPFAGRIRVDVAATAAERQAWQPWLAALIGQMVPLTARVRLRWVSAQALRGMRLDGALVLAGPPQARLDSEAVLGVARLPDNGGRITASGADLGTRLQ